MKKNVLVFPCGSEIGLEVYRCLCFSTHFKLFGGSSVDDHGRFVYQNYIGGLPKVEEPDFIDKINELIIEHKIEYVIPAHDSVVLALARAKANNNLGCEVITSPVDTCEVTRSKKKTYEMFNGIVPTPKLYDTPADVSPVDFPVFLKPNIGQGSKGTFLARSKNDLDFYIANDPSLLVLENLPGKEYTIDCFTNKDRKLLFCEGRERARILNGISVNSTTVKDKRFAQIAQAINEKLVVRGVWFFQVKEDRDGELVLMEVAPRVAGTMALVRSRGVNLVLLSLFDAMGEKVSILENDYQPVLDRALENTYQIELHYEHVYIDLDDLVILNDQVNTNAIAYIYQCINKGIKIHLLTKHKKELDKTLKTFRLNDVFDELIHIKDDDEKHLYIKEKSAIFIDDSFEERKKVKEMFGIPVFDAHMLEALVKIN